MQVFRENGDLKLVWTIARSNYLYRGRIGATDAMPPGASIAVQTPPGQAKDDPNFGRQEVYHDAVSARIASTEIQRTGKIVVTYQGCAEQFQICYPPVRKTVDLDTLTISEPSSLNARAPGDGGSFFVDAPSSLASEQQAQVPGRLEDRKRDASSWLTLGWTLASFFGFGLLLSFSPCTFPMVPIFFGLLAGSTSRPSVVRGFSLASAFVGASASAYALLGAFAAWSGSGENLQILLQTPLALGIMSTVLLVFSLSMFGLFELQLPNGFLDRVSAAASAKRTGPLAAAAMLGFGSALIAGPCVTPPLATALLYVARTGDVARGMTTLFLFGVGMGIPLLIFGAFGPRFLPKPGAWLVRVRQIFGFILLGVAIWMVSRVLSEWLTLQLWGALAIGLAVYLGTQFLTAQGVSRFAWAVSASLALLAGSILLIGSAGDESTGATRILDRFVALHPTPESWPKVVRSIKGLDREFAAARIVGKPVMLDFSADWCVECKVMDAVLRKPALEKPLEDFWIVRADVTTVDVDSRALMQRFEVVGPPTILLFGPLGEDDRKTRIVGVIDANALLTKLSALTAVR
jgi:thiol:disulfide interchange protein DsbD